MRIFKNKLRKKTAKIGVVGLGYVGLPLALTFAKKGFSVTGIEVHPEKLKSLRQGRSYILDVASRELKGALAKKRLRVTDDACALHSLDAVIICVPTPLNKNNEPDLSFIMRASRQIAHALKPGQLVVLESTTYPGTTQEELQPLLEKSGLKCGRDFFLAFSPERIDPGNKNYGTQSIPKVVGGVEKNSTEAARLLYASILKSVVGVSSAKTAEMVKLLENSFRSVNIAFINEMAKISHSMGVNIWEVIEAAKTKPFGFMPFYPGPGTGGHCIPVDPLYLSWRSKRHDRMITLASSINKKMPEYILRRIKQLLHKRKASLKKAKILLLGVAYKKNVDDCRESPASEVLKLLWENGCQVSYCDPYVPSIRLKNGRSFKSQKLTRALLRKQDCVAVLTDHSVFDYASVAQNARLIFDARNVMRKFNPRKELFFL